MQRAREFFIDRRNALIRLSHRFEPHWHFQEDDPPRYRCHLNSVFGSGDTQDFLERGSFSRRPQNRNEQWHIDVQANESEAARMANSNTSVQPYVFFNGRCEEALEFYRSAVGAEVEMLSRFKDAPEPGMTQSGMENKVMHASFRIGDTLLMASDGRCDGHPRFEGFSLSILVPDEEKAESVFNALADGGKVTMPLEKTFWAPKFGMLEDQFGVGWMVSVQHKP